MADSGRTIGERYAAEDLLSKVDVPTVRPAARKVVCCTICDLHLSPTPPPLRAEEPDWYEAQARHLKQVHECCARYQCPLIIAGDIFDDGWRERKCPPELINFAIKYLKCPYGTYAIPGQHDLPHHRYEDIRKSAYWTLVEAGVIEDLPPRTPIRVTEGLMVVGFPWGSEVNQIPDDTWHRDVVKLAVVHAYCWKDGHSFPGCPQEQHVKEWAYRLDGYTAAVFGDNHKGFAWNADRRVDDVPAVRNGGTFMVRRTDEMDFAPNIGLLYDNGTWGCHLLDPKGDKFATTGIVEADDPHTFADVVQVLNDLSEDSLDFRHALETYVRKNAVSDGVKAVIIRALERGK